MKILRALEAGSAVLAGLVGLAALTLLLFTPSYAGETCQASDPGGPASCTPYTATLLDVNGLDALLPLAIFALLPLGIGISGVRHSRTGAPGARTTLWVITASLTAFSLLAILSIGSLFLPSVALALIACALSLGHRRPALA
jgi:hypothetical protein